MSAAAMQVERLPGWERRLREVVRAAGAVPYKLGENDCFRLACSVVQALIGVDRWPEFAGRYTSERESMRLLAEHGSSFEEAFDWFFGRPRVDWKLAQRGDICAWKTPDGQKHLGVCEGLEVALMTDKGIMRAPMRTVLCAWKVG